MGALLEADAVLFATLPGVPAETQRMFEGTLEPLIRKRSEGVIVSLMLRFAGISDEEPGEKLQDLIDAQISRSLPWSDRARSVAAGSTLASPRGPPRVREPTNIMEPIAEEILRRLSEY
jgi:molybdopterin-biosynthesis enzyme MoeA-like protein